MNPPPVPDLRPSALALALLLPLAAMAPAAPAPLAAQEVAAPRLLTLPASTRGMALGGAVVPGEDEPDVALFVHPALLVDAGGFGLQFQRWGAESSATQVAATGDWFGGDVGVGVGLRALQYSLGGSDPAFLTGTPDALFTGGGLPVSERVATLGLAREVLGLRVGVTGALVEQRIGSDRDATAAVDVGLATDAGPFTVALSARNLGPDLEMPTGAISLPRLFELGAGAYGREVGPLDLGVAGSVVWDETADEVIPGAGLEVGYWPVRGRTFVARFGVRRVPGGDGSPFGGGLAFWGDDLVLEWAWRPFDGAVDDATHRFSVGWR